MFYVIVEKNNHNYIKVWEARNFRELQKIAFEQACGYDNRYHYNFRSIEGIQKFFGHDFHCGFCRIKKVNTIKECLELVKDNYKAFKIMKNWIKENKYLF